MAGLRSFQNIGKLFVAQKKRIQGIRYSCYKYNHTGTPFQKIYRFIAVVVFRGFTIKSESLEFNKLEI